MDDRRAFLQAGALALLGASLPALAGRAATLPRIAYLTPGSNPRESAFWEGMRDLGYVEGRTIVVDRRSAEGDFSRLPALALELLNNRPDLIAVAGSAAASAARDATTTLPIVLVGAGDPVAAGLVGNLARPGGNITGTSTQSHAAVGKLLQMVREVRPGASRVAALWDPVNAISQQLRLGETLTAAARLNLFTRVLEVGSPDELERAFVSLRANPPDAVMVSGDTFFINHASRVAELGIASRLPVLTTNRQLAEAGVLVAYGADLNVVARRAAPYVQKIIRGAKAGDLPIELPTKFELVLNLRTARAIGLAVPSALVARSDEVIR